MSDSPESIDDFTKDELQTLHELAQDLDKTAERTGVSRRDIMQSAAVLGVGAMAGGVSAQQLIEHVSAQADTTDEHGNVGLPSDRVDVFADGIDANVIDSDTVSTERTNSTVFVSPGDDLQTKADEAAGERLEFLPGEHLSYVTDVHDGTEVYIPPSSTIKLAGDANPDNEDGVLQAVGTENDLITVTITLDGEIDGNKAEHGDVDKIEGIEIEYGEGCVVDGTGTIRDTVDDGVDWDLSNRCRVEGINFIDCGGWGVHPGGGGDGNHRNWVVNCYAEGCGFDEFRGGFDQNSVSEGTIFVGCTAKDNRQNFLMEGDGAILTGCKSIDTGSVSVEDDFTGAVYAQVNGNVQREGVGLYNLSSDQTIANDETTTVEFDDIDEEDESIISFDTSNNEATINADGRYQIYCVYQFLGDSEWTTGDEIIGQVRINGSTTLQVDNRKVGDERQSGDMLFKTKLSPDDTVSVRVRQDSGVSQTLRSASGVTTKLQITKVG